MISKKILLKFLSIFILFILLDAIYLYLCSNIFSTAVKSISGKSLTSRYYSGVIVYIVLAIGVMVFVLPNIRTNSIMNIVKDSVMYGGLFGLVTYATFDFTNHFMFEGWSLGISLLDTTWGTILTALVTICFCYLDKYHLHF